MKTDMPVHKWTFADVEDFCKLKIPEGLYIDYKQDLPENYQIAKHIAAFANTEGGWILIGVREEREKPVEVIGIDIDNVKSYISKIEQIVRDNINPRPKIKVFEALNADNTKVVIIIVIPPSLEAPHRLLTKDEIFIRTGQSSHSENQQNSNSENIRLFQFKDLDYLYDSRKKSVDFKERLINSSFERFKNNVALANGNNTIHINFSCPSKNIAQVINEPNSWYIKNSTFFFFACPMFPQKETLIDYSRISNLILDINQKFDFINNTLPSPPSPIEGGYSLSRNGKNQKITESFGKNWLYVDVCDYFEINEYGVISLIINANNDDITKYPTWHYAMATKGLYLTKLANQLIKNLIIIKTLYTDLNYYGSIDLRYFINITPGSFAVIDVELNSKLKNNNIVDDFIAFQEDISLIDFTNNFESIVTAILKRFFHNLAVDEIEPKFIDNYIKETLKSIE